MPVSIAPEVIDLCSLAGLELREQQRALVGMVFAEDGEGRPLAPDVPLYGDYWSAMACVLGWLFLRNLVVVWAAATSAGQRDHSDDLFELVAADEAIRRQVRKVTKAKGAQSLTVASGGRVVFVAAGGGRGFSADRLVLENPSELRRASLIPILMGRPGGQLVRV